MEINVLWFEEVFAKLSLVCVLADISTYSYSIPKLNIKVLSLMQSVSRNFPSPLNIPYCVTQAPEGSPSVVGSK